MSEDVGRWKSISAVLHGKFSLLIKKGTSIAYFKDLSVNETLLSSPFNNWYFLFNLRLAQTVNSVVVILSPALYEFNAELCKPDLL